MQKQTLRKAGFGLLVFIAVMALGVRMYLPIWLTDYVNKTIDNIDGYTGSISDVDIALWRGAYQIHDLRLDKVQSNIPEPFFSFKTADLSIQWGALFKGRVVGTVDLHQPNLTFAKGRDATTQTGEETDWTQPIKDLMPLDINRLTMNGGKIAYKNYATDPEVNIYIDHIEMTATNLRNVDDKNVALPSDAKLKGRSIGNGQLEITGKMNILRQIPDFDFDIALEDADLTAINTYSEAFAAIDFETGTLDVYSELAAKDGAVSGYVKPIARNLSLLSADKSEGSIFGVLWEGFVAALMEIFQNQSLDQFATQAELEGDISDPETNMWSIIGGIVRNAFVEAISRGTNDTVNFKNAPSEEQ